MYTYKVVVTGGTFDHLHAGHKSFLRQQLQLSEKILIGVTSDVFIKKYKQEGEPFTTRVKNLKQFLISEQVLERIEIEKIEDVYIPKAWEKYPIEAIAVTPDTKQGALQINHQRVKNGQTALPITTIAHILAEDGGVLSSSRIRAGELDREGKVYIKSEWLQKNLYLPQELRKKLGSPFGQFFETIAAWNSKNIYDPNTIVSIGDEITEGLLQNRFGQKVSVVDLFVQRKKIYASLAAHTFTGDETIISIKNPAGVITSSLFQAARKSIFEEGKFIVSIDGEEDLAVLPFLLSAPLNYHILYGQPQKGIVVIRVTETYKKRARDLLEKFTYQPQKHIL